MNESLFTVSDTAKMFDKSRQTIYNWIEAGRFPNSFEVGSGKGTVMLIPASDIDKVKQEEAEKLVKRLRHLGFQGELVPV